MKSQLVLLCGWLSLCAACDSSPRVGTGRSPAGDDREDPPRVSVQVEVDFAGRLPNKSARIELPPGATVLDCLLELRRQQRLTFHHVGSQGSAFVQSIDGLENGGAAGDNWVFRVNGQLGQTSCGLAVLKSGDQLNWRYGKYDP
jgi:hypothetical protein